MGSPRTIHDFTGFPDELFAFQYNAPGHPELAKRIQELLAPINVIADHSWGLDHGTWSVLAHLFPDADVPVVQLSIDATLSMREHIAIGRSLSSLCDEDILILGSGNVVHNLSRINWSDGENGYEWADRFDGDIARMMDSDPLQLVEADSHPDWLSAAPTPEHFLPLAYIAGIAAERNVNITRFNDARVLGSLSMTSYVASDV